MPREHQLPFKQQPFSAEERAERLLKILSNPRTARYLTSGANRGASGTQPRPPMIFRTEIHKNVREANLQPRTSADLPTRQ